MSNTKHQFDDETLTVERSKVQKPRLFKVLMHNDDYTPMDFVVTILENIFHKNHDDAIQIMLAIHQRGIGLCGLYPYEIAEKKHIQVKEIARQNGFPLKCSIEPEE